MSALPERFAEYIATLRDAGEAPSMSRYPGLPSQPWYDAAAIPAAVALERAAPQIIAEFGQLDPSAFVPEAEPIARSGSRANTTTSSITCASAPTMDPI